MALVESTLATMGVSGAIITVLMMVCGVLSIVIVKQYTDAAKVYKYRLSERDTLAAALNDSTAALKAMLEQLKATSGIAAELTDLIQKQSAAFELLNERLLSGQKIVQHDVHRIEQAISAIAEAMRVVTSMVEQIKHAIPNSVQEVKNAIASNHRGQA